MPDQEKPKLFVQMIQWIILAKLAKEVDAILGDEAEIVVMPRGKSDVARAEKVSRFVNWRWKQSLKIFEPYYEHLEQKNVLGTSILFIGWKTKYRTVKAIEMQQQIIDVTLDTPMGPITVPTPQMVPVEVDKEVVDFDGPDIRVENIEDFVFPRTAKGIDDAHHYFVVLKPSYDDILDMLQNGEMDSTVVDEQALKKLKHLAETGSADEDVNSAANAIAQEKSHQEGAAYSGAGEDGRIRLYMRIGKYLPKDAKVTEKSYDAVCYYQPDLNMVMGAMRLVDKFPDGRRPHVMTRAIKQWNQLWGTGYAELLEGISDELNAFMNLFLACGEAAIGPVILATPAAGEALTKQKLDANSVVFTADPQGAREIQLGNVQLATFVQVIQVLLSFAERLTGLTDAQMGRQMDQPNAPRTYGQQALLQGESNVRLLLDTRLERSADREVIHRIWELDKRFMSPEVFFRVSEAEPGDVMTKEEMQGDYDFDLGPVTSVSSKPQRMQEGLQALALAMQAQLPQVAFPMLKKVLEKLGHPDVAAMVPDVAQMKPPESPETENARLAQGEDVDPHPMDNHAAHIAKHEDFLRRIQNTDLGNGITMETMNPGVSARVQAHIAEHQQVMKQGIMSAAALAMGGMGGNGNGQTGMGTQSPLAGLLGQGSPQQEANPGAAQNSAMRNAGTLNLG